jgi:hypothetical protein
MNTVWDVRGKDWANFLFSRVRGLRLLAIPGTITVAATFSSGFGVSGGAGRGGIWIVGVLASLVP